jgi:ABC-type dipeptide/oligopeptide/nickel transport system permease component
VPDFVWKQLVSMLVTLFVASIFIFSLVRLVPGDPVVAAIGVDNYTPDLYEATARRWGFTCLCISSSVTT